MINFLTQKEVSEDMLKVLEDLKNDKMVSFDTLMNLPEIKEGYRISEEYAQKTHNSNIDINKVMDLILQRGSISSDKDGNTLLDQQHNIVFNGKINKEHRADFVIGLPASGKSSTLVEPLSIEFKSRVIDCDEIKKLLPGYNDGWGSNQVHEISKSINNSVLFEAAKHGENIVYPIVGSNAEKVERMANALKDIGYKVYLHYNELSSSKAIGRCINRFLEEGRFLDLNIFYKYGDKVNDTYNLLSQKEGLFNGYSKFNNDVSRGEKPKLIESNCRGKLWNTEKEVYSINTGNDRGLRGFSNRNTREVSSDKEIRKVISSLGYKPNSSLISSFEKLFQTISKESISLKRLNSLSKGNGKEKNIACDILKELKLQRRNHDLER